MEFLVGTSAQITDSPGQHQRGLTTVILQAANGPSRNKYDQKLPTPKLDLTKWVPWVFKTHDGSHHILAIEILSAFFPVAGVQHRVLLESTTSVHLHPYSEE